jgi:hypothetical protein
MTFAVIGTRAERGRRTFQCVDHHQNFHQIVVGRRARRVQHENVAAADVFEKLDHHLPIGESSDDATPEADVHVADDGFGELRVRVAGEDAHPFKGHRRVLDMNRTDPLAANSPAARPWQ